jgi:hypothetical protein
MAKSSEKKLAQSREYYYKNRDKRLMQAKKWQEANKDKVSGYLKTWRDKNRDKLNKANKDYQRLRRKSKEGKDCYYKYKYNITFDEYSALLEGQNSCCAICKKKPTNKHLAVDHCHKTGKIRGLLCNSCNRAIGLMKDDITLLKNSIKYLTKK